MITGHQIREVRRQGVSVQQARSRASVRFGQNGAVMAAVAHRAVLTLSVFCVEVEVLVV